MNTEHCGCAIVFIDCEDVIHVKFIDLKCTQ